MKTTCCGDSGGRNGSGKPCGSTKALNPVNGRCYYHDPDRPRVIVGSDVTTTPTRVSQSEWPQARRQRYAERGMVIVDRVLDDLRAGLNANLFLYEQTAAMEPLLLVISTQTLLGALLEDVQEGRRMGNREIDRLYSPAKPLPVEDGVGKVPARVQLA